LKYFQDENEEFEETMINKDDIEGLDLSKEPEKLYLVKWKNLSYMDATWE